VIAGSIVHHFSYRVGFLFLAAIAAGALALLFFGVPETLHIRERKENR
jgi:MFS family permease